MKAHNRLFRTPMLCLIMCAVLLTGCAAKNEQAGAPEAPQEQTAEKAPEAGTAQNGEKDADAGKDAAAETEPAAEDAEAPAGLPEVLILQKDRNEYDEKYDVLLYSGHFEGVALSEQSKVSWPALYDALQKDWEEDLKTYENSVLSLTEESAEQYRSMRQDDPNTEYSIHYEDRYSADVTRVDDKVFSWSSEFYFYYGGAHGMYGNSGRSYDVKTGKRLNLSEVITDGKAFGQLLFDKVSVEYPDVVDYLEDKDSLRDQIVEEVLKDPENWALEPFGIDYFFNPYDIAAYAAGEQIIHIDYEEAPELFAKDYLPDPQEKVIHGVPNGRDVYLDADGDGKTDHITIDINYGDWDEEQEDYTSLGISAFVGGGQECELVTYYYVEDIKTRVASFATGEQYLIITCLADYTFRQMIVCSVGDGYVNVEGEYGLRQKSLYNPEDLEIYGDYELIDPDRLLFTERFDRLATFFAEGEYTITDKGAIEPVNEYALVSEDAQEYLKLTSAAELTVEIVDEEGNTVKEEETLPAGTVYTLYRTNYEDEIEGVPVDCLLEDGRIARLSYKVTGETGNMVCNVNEQEAFKELLYAD